MRSLLTILMLSQGVPMITAGDEFGRSQLGNNNAWCQDNPISWLDWKLCRKNQDLLRFFRQCIELRRRHPVFRREDFFAGPDGTTGRETEEVHWQYLKPGNTDWSDSCHGLGMLLSGSRKNHPRDDDFFLIINGSQNDPLRFTVPPVPPNTRGRRWHLVIDTAAGAPLDINLQGAILEGLRASVVQVEPMAVKLLQSMPIRP